MIRRIFLDLDDVCNTLAPFVLHSVGCDIGPSDYGDYPREHGFNISDAANELLGEPRYTPATLWASIPRAVWVKVPESPFFLWLLETCAEAVGRENICIATSPTKCPESLAGKLEWIHDHFPAWMHRQYAITPRKHLLARPDSLLIDDYGENAGRFRAHGGHAFLVPRPWNDNWASDPRDFVEETLAAALQKPAWIPS
ncbi:MAG TPA: hypothetical protein PLT20_09015 [Sedimentisphaerales bacterium]|nr:hypothetical protein [Sedimentisphaerales bacterium]